MIKELCQKNRSYRRFVEEKRIPKEELWELVNLARFSPCAANLQNLSFFLVYEPELCALLFPHLKWAGYLRYWDGPEKGERPAAYIIILAPANSTRFHNLDTGIAAQSIMLGASEKGWGGCMLASVDKPAVMEDFNLPTELEITLVLALGFPAEQVVLEDVIDPDDIEYWRDAEGVHHVPKRQLADLILSP